MTTHPVATLADRYAEVIRERDAALAEVTRLKRRLASRYCGCGWCCSTVPAGQAGAAHLAVCVAQRREPT